MTPLKQKLKQGLEKRIYNEDEFIDEVLNFQKDIILNRLKEQYYEVKRCLFPNEADYVRARYGGMREFCLDTQLVSFNDIEQMEFEVNQSFS